MKSVLILLVLPAVADFGFAAGGKGRVADHLAGNRPGLGSGAQENFNLTRRFPALTGPEAAAAN